MTKWQAWKLKVWNWCKNSGTIVWARIQYIAGILGAGMIAAFSSYDWNQLVAFDPKTIFKMLLFATISGVITEWVRKRGTVQETTVVANAATNFEPAQVVRLERVADPPPPVG